MASLILMNEGMERQQFPLGRAILMIGRNEDAGLQLESHEVSKNHASIVFIDGSYLVRDNGSTNGTFVNGEKVVSERKLKHEDVIHFGPYTFMADFHDNKEEDTKVIKQSKDANLEHRGQHYRKTVTLDPVRGKEKAGPLQIMMADRPRQELTGVSATTGTGMSWGWLTACAMLLLAVFYFYRQLSETKNQLQAESAQAQVLATSVTQLQELQVRLDAAVRRTGEVEQLLAQNEQDFDKYKHANETGKTKALEDRLQKAKAEMAIWKQKVQSMDGLVKESSKNVPSEKTEKPAVFDSMVAWPPEIRATKEIQIPIIANGKAVGYGKTAVGTLFKVIKADAETVTVDVGGLPFVIAKSDTNFAQALGIVVEAKKQEMAQATANKVAAEELNRKEKEALLKEQKEREELAKNKVEINVIIDEIMPDRFFGRRFQGTIVLVSGLETSKLVEGERWKGEVYEIGIYYKTGTDKRVRCYTVDFNSYVLYKKSGVADGVQNPPQLVPPISLEEMTTVFDALKIAETLLAIREAKYNKKTSFSVSKVKVIQNESAKWRQAAEMASNLLQNKKMDSVSAYWLRKVVAADGLCTVERFDLFESKVKEVDEGWPYIKSAFVTVPKTVTP